MTLTTLIAAALFCILVSVYYKIISLALQRRKGGWTMGRADVVISMPVSVVFCGIKDCVHNTGEACGRLWIKIAEWGPCESREDRQEKE